jgi:hypothetical protein
MKIVKIIKDHHDKTNDNPSKIKFTILHGQDKTEEIVSYINLLENISKDQDNAVILKFKRIITLQDASTMITQIKKDLHIILKLNGKMGRQLENL